MPILSSRQEVFSVREAFFTLPVPPGKPLSRYLSGDRPSAVKKDRLALDVGISLVCEEDSQVGDIFDGAEPADGDLVKDIVERFLRR